MIAAVSLIGILDSGTAARADDTDGISGAPSDGVDTDDRSRFSYQVAPGQVLNDFYWVKNTGTTDTTMTVFATDAYNADDGAYGLLDTDMTPVDAGSWVAFAGGATRVDVPLAPGASQVIPFTLTVPADASPGDHPAGILISVRSLEGEIRVDRRIGTRLYVRVPGDLQPQMTISSLKASYEGQLNPLNGRTTLTFTIDNTGNIALSGRLLLGAKTFFGIPVGELVRQNLDEILPGNSRTISVSIPGVPQVGYLNPSVQLAPTVDEGAMDAGQIPQASRDTVILATPWWLIILLALVLLVAAVLRIRRARDERAARDFLAYVDSEARRTAEDDRDAVLAGTSPRESPGQD